jgi:hypothetical protein
MKSFQTERQFSYKELLYKSIIFLATVTLLVYFLPREGKFNYQFDINKPWKYGLLQASFDFPIYKQVQHEQDSVMAAYRPYYGLDKRIGDEMIKKFKDDYASTLYRIIPNPTYRNHIERLLKEIYEQGVIGVNDLSNLRKDSFFHIRIVDRNISSQRDINNLYTIKQAYEALIKSDTIHYNKRMLQLCNLNNYIAPNLIYDAEKSESAKQDLLSNISWASGFVMNGQKIIDRGEIINQQTYNILKSLQKEWSKRSETTTEKRLTLFGQILFVAILIGIFFTYLELFRKDYYSRKRCLYLLFSIIVIFPIISFIMVEHAFLNVYIVPFAMIPIIIRIFLDSRTAFMAHITSILLCSIVLRTPHEFILLQTVAGMAGIYSLRELSVATSAKCFYRNTVLCDSLSGTRPYSRQYDSTTQHEYVYQFYPEWNSASIHLSVAVYIGKDLRIHFQRNISRALQHQQQTNEGDVGSSTRYFPTLLTIG